MRTRREFFLSILAGMLACTRRQELSHRERVDRALRGEPVDRPPFTFYYHFGKTTAEEHAQATLEFHRKFRTDLVKVMSDFPFPKPEGPWYELEVLDNPFPEQVRALELIAQGLQGEAHFIETIFNSWNVAEKLSSKEEVQRLKERNPKLLLEVLDRITESQIHHARRAIQAGASGIFLAIANADASVLSRQDYQRFSEPFDKRILEAVADAPLNTLHLHGERVYLDLFYQGWAASVLQYSRYGTGIEPRDVRKHYQGVIMGGLDERRFRKLTERELREQWQSAQEQIGLKFILAPGCSVPNETTDEELMRLVRVLEA